MTETTATKGENAITANAASAANANHWNNHFGMPLSPPISVIFRNKLPTIN